MSTLSIATPESDVDARFDALVLCPAPTQHAGRDNAPFETVFDLDYGQATADPAPVVRQPTAHRIRVAPQPRSTSRGAVRLTRRGRLVLVLAFLGLAFALMIPLSGWATATLSGGTPEPVRIIEVGPGDTLYGIAGELAEPGEVRAMVHRIQELNSLPGGMISEGQKLAVPRG